MWGSLSCPPEPRGMTCLVRREITAKERPLTPNSSWRSQFSPVRFPRHADRPFASSKDNRNVNRRTFPAQGVPFRGAQQDLPTVPGSISEPSPRLHLPPSPPPPSGGLCHLLPEHCIYPRLTSCSLLPILFFFFFSRQ